MANRYLYIVRHGQYDPEAAAPDSLGGGLSKLGQRQAEKTAKALKSVPISAIHYSTLRRAEQTAKPIFEAFPEARQHRAKRLWECIPHVTEDTMSMFEGFTPEELKIERQKAQSAFAHYFKGTRGKDKHEVLVAHANLIRYFVCRAMGVYPGAWLNLDSRNCGITRVRVDSDGFTMLISYNDIGHLPPGMHTDNMEDI